MKLLHPFRLEVEIRGMLSQIHTKQIYQNIVSEMSIFIDRSRARQYNRHSWWAQRRASPSLKALFSWLKLAFPCGIRVFRSTRTLVRR